MFVNMIKLIIIYFKNSRTKGELRGEHYSYKVLLDFLIHMINRYNATKNIQSVDLNNI